MDKILFLDFDGPLFPYRFIKYHAKQRAKYPGKYELPPYIDYWVMEPLAVELLNFLYDLHPFKTVVSSTWREHLDKKQIEELFEVNDLNLQLHNDWFTPRVGFRSDNSTRAREIFDYIEDKGITDYLVLDDTDSGGVLKYHMEEGNERVIIVEPDVGIDSESYKKMLGVVKSWAKIENQESSN